MKPSEAQKLAVGYVGGWLDAQAEHGTECCCKNCPWKGNHGRVPEKVAVSRAVFARMFANAHRVFNADGGVTPPSIASAFRVWQASDGKAIQ